MNRPSREDFSGSENPLRDAVTVDKYMPFCSVIQSCPTFCNPMVRLGEGNANPLLYSCLALAGHAPWGRRESNTTEATKHARTHGL